MSHVPCFYLPKGHQVIIKINNPGDYKSEDLKWACKWTSQAKLMSIHCHGSIYSKNPGSQPQVTRFTVMLSGTMLCQEPESERLGTLGLISDSACSS